MIIGIISLPVHSEAFTNRSLCAKLDKVHTCLDMNIVSAPFPAKCSEVIASVGLIKAYVYSMKIAYTAI